MSSRNSIRTIDMRFLDRLFKMESGWVLDFTNKTFAEFFRDELNINIDHPRYETEGTSKAKRLRYFLRTEDQNTVIQTLLALWEYRETGRRREGEEEDIPNAEDEFYAIIERLGGKRPQDVKQPSASENASCLNKQIADRLVAELIKISDYEAQPRGYQFEKFLKQLFDANELSARASFRLQGEQIDGSFVLNGETYLLEAKWTTSKVDAATLRSFNSKVEDKAAWSRGLFVSYSGFTEDGIEAFGRGKRVVCMDGLDLWEMLSNQLPFSDVMSKKVRRAAETGRPFVRVRDLYRLR